MGCSIALMVQCSSEGTADLKKKDAVKLIRVQGSSDAVQRISMDRSSRVQCN